MTPCALAVTLLLRGATPVTDAGTPSSQLEGLLAQHRAAMGGDHALSTLQRWKITSRVKAYGLAGMRVDYADGHKRRSEETFPELPLQTVDVWDGEHLVEQGTNGDVRQLSGPEEEEKRTDVAVSSLAYLRPGTKNKIQLLPSVEDAGQHYERIQVTAPGGSPIELWLDAAGMPRRRLSTSEGAVTTTYIDEYGKYRGIPLPKRTRITRSVDTNVNIVETVSAEFPKQLSASLFSSPKPKSDAVFPAGKVSITLPLALWGGRYVVVQARLSGHLGTFLLDTGASSTALDFSFLKKVGAKPKGQVAPAGGLFKGISFVRTGPMEFGELRFGPQTVLALDLHASNSVFPAHMDGILGYDFLSRFPLTVDYVAGWLTFWKSEAYRPLPEELQIPITFAGTQIRVPVSINGEAAGGFLLDIGNGGLCSVQHAPLAHPLSPPKGKTLLYEHGQEFGTGSASGYLTHADITVGEGKQSVTWRAAPIIILNLQDPHAGSVGGTGNLGNAFFRHFRLTLDYGASKIYLLQRESFRPASLTGTYGVEIRPMSGKLVVRDVPAGGPAASAGLKPGDEVLDVDGAPVVNIENELPSFLSRPVPGEEHKVRVQRGDSVMTIKLTAEASP